MKSKLIVTMIAVLLLTQACAPSTAVTSPSSSSTSTVSNPSPPIVETTLPQTEITPVVSTAVASTSTSLTEAPPTISSGDNSIPDNGITLQDNGKTFIMHVGDSFLLNLGTDIYDWTVEVESQNVLHLKVGVMVIRGAQGIYEALAPGTATLTATGNPLCLQSHPPCAIPSILFSVTIVVE